MSHFPGLALLAVEAVALIVWLLYPRFGLIGGAIGVMALGAVLQTTALTMKALAPG